RPGAKESPMLSFRLLTVSFWIACLLSCLFDGARIVYGQTNPAPAPGANPPPAPGTIPAAPGANPPATTKPPDPCRHVEHNRHVVPDPGHDPEPPDLVWYVVPPKIVQDNYGHNVRNKFVMIDVTVKNICQESQIAILSFAIRPDHDDAYWNGHDPYKNTDP